MDLKVSFDAKKTLRALERSPETTAKHMRRALQKSCRLVREGARQKHNFKSRTGMLEHAIRYRTNIAKCEGIIDIDLAVAPYGIFVHEPTGKHAEPGRRLPSKFYRWPDGSYAIRPVNRRYLRFVRDGKFVFAREVRHPGSPADPFLYDSAERNRNEINDIFARHTREAWKEAGL